MKEEIIYECLKCKKQFKKFGWYKRHCKTKHKFILPPITKKVFKSHEINAIFNKIDSLEKKIDQLLKTGITARSSYHDIDIRRISKNEIINDKSEKSDLRREIVSELKGLSDRFNKDIKNILTKIEEDDLTEDQRKRLNKYIIINSNDIELIN